MLKPEIITGWSEVMVSVCAGGVVVPVLMKFRIDEETLTTGGAA